MRDGAFKRCWFPLDNDPDSRKNYAMERLCIGQEIGVVIIWVQCKMKNRLLVCWSLRFWFVSQLVLCGCLFVHSLVPSFAPVWCMG